MVCTVYFFLLLPSPFLGRQLSPSGLKKYLSSIEIELQLVFLFWMKSMQMHGDSLLNVYLRNVNPLKAEIFLKLSWSLEFTVMRHSQEFSNPKQNWTFMQVSRTSSLTTTKNVILEDKINLKMWGKIICNYWRSERTWCAWMIIQDPPPERLLDPP